MAEDQVKTKTPRETGKEETEDDDRLTASRLSPSKTVEERRDNSGSPEWTVNGNRQNSAPSPGTSTAVSPMRPSRKRVLSAGHESDTEPGSAWPDEWEITESNREGEVRGGGGGKEVQQAQRVAGGKKPRASPRPSRKRNGVASSSLALTRRLKAKGVRESPRVRKLRDKLGGRVGAGFPNSAGASTGTSVAMLQGKGTDRSSSGEATGPSMPYSGDNVSFPSRLVGCKVEI